jgi:ureidoglycolate hydrolase
MKRVVSQHVTPENFRRFGKVIAVLPDVKPDGQSEIQTYYGKLAIMKCENSIQLGICVAVKRENVVDELEQHVETQELLAALKGDFLVPVTASVVVNGKARPDMDKMIAVRVNQGEGIVFDEGIWHWTPYPVTPTSDVLVGFKTNTPKNDFVSCKLEEKFVID